MILSCSAKGVVRVDLIYLGIVLGFFALSWALLALCERL
jgi:hypothetical protein